MILTLLLLAAPAECDDREGDVAAAECWYAAERAADDELDRIWPDVLRAARDADKHFSPTPRKNHPSAAADLLASQRSWLEYRDSQCALEGDYAQGGSLENVLVGQCQTNLTRQRTKQLQEIAAGFREG